MKTPKELLEDVRGRKHNLTHHTYKTRINRMHCDSGGVALLESNQRSGIHNIPENQRSSDYICKPWITVSARQQGIPQQLPGPEFARPNDAIRLYIRVEEVLKRTFVLGLKIVFCTLSLFDRRYHSCDQHHFDKPLTIILESHFVSLQCAWLQARDSQSPWPKPS